MEKITYAEKLKDPRWQKKRLEIFQRDKFRCMECFSDEKSLQVHHIAYKGKEPWDTPNKLLITYCHECHQKEEDKLKAAGENFVKLMRADGQRSIEMEYFLNNLKYLIEKDTKQTAVAFLSLAIVDERLFKYINKYIAKNID
jgi:hypothetical protein